MPRGRAISLPRDLVEVLERYYARHIEELRFKRGIRSLSGLVSAIIMEAIREEGELRAVENGHRDRYRPMIRVANLEEEGLEAIP